MIADTGNAHFIIINQPEEEIVDDLESDGDISVPEQAIQPNPWVKMMMMTLSGF